MPEHSRARYANHFLLGFARDIRGPPNGILSVKFGGVTATLGSRLLFDDARLRCALCQDCARHRIFSKNFKAQRHGDTPIQKLDQKAIVLARGRFGVTGASDSPTAALRFRHNEG
jgi:hypothetical protein